MTDSGDRMARAGNYVLGLMDDFERERAERDLEIDPAFRDAVAALAVRMHAFDHGTGPEPAPDGLWREIEARIAAMPQMRGGDAKKPVFAEDGEPPVAFGRRRSGRQAVKRPAKRRRAALASVPAWRAASLAACLLAAAGIGYLARAMTSERVAVAMVVLDTGDDVPGAVFEAFSDDRLRIVQLRDFAVPEGKILQAWTLYDRAVGPVSLGTLGEARETILQGPDLPPPMPGQLYEITLEPAPGSPTGKPSGPILAKGFATRAAGI